MKNNKHQNIIITFFLLFLFQLAAVNAQTFPDSFFIFRDTIYLQNRELLETMRLYTTAKQDIEKTLTGADLCLALSRCEYLMGISFRSDDRSAEAAAFFEQGIALAEKSLELQPTSEGYRILGTNVAFLCEVRSSYGLRNFGRIEENAKKAIELDPNNLVAQYLLAAQYIVAPWPLNNLKKGSQILGEITALNYLTLEKEDLFNLYLMLELACLKQKKNGEAQIWHDKAMALYSTNNFIALLVK